MRHWLLAGLVVVSGGCFASRGAGPPRPDATSSRWRGLVGCYQLEDGQFALDSVGRRRGDVGNRTLRSTSTQTTSVITSGLVTSIPKVEVTASNRFSEVIGGRLAELYENQYEREHVTGAGWSSPAVYLTGKSRDAGIARLQLQVFRTRFTQP